GARSRRAARWPARSSRRNRGGREMPPIVIKARTDGAEPTARFSVDVGNSVRTYVTYDEDEGEKGHAITRSLIADQILATLGTTNPGPSPRPFGSPGGRGSLDRVMPLADPMYLNCFADQVSVRVDRGELYEEATTDRLDAALAVPPILAG